MTKDLTDADIKAIATKIIRPTLKYLMKQIDKELVCKHPTIKTDNFIYVVVFFMSSLDANVLVWLRNLHKGIDFNKLMTVYIEHLMQVMTNDERKRLKEKLN